MVHLGDSIYKATPCLVLIVIYRSVVPHQVRGVQETWNEVESCWKRRSSAARSYSSVEDWADLECINEVIKTLGGCGHTHSPRLNYIIISLSKIMGVTSSLTDVLIIEKKLSAKNFRAIFYRILVLTVLFYTSRKPVIIPKSLSIITDLYYNNEVGLKKRHTRSFYTHLGYVLTFAPTP